MVKVEVKKIKQLIIGMEGETTYIGYTLKITNQNFSYYLQDLFSKRKFMRV